MYTNDEYFFNYLCEGLRYVSCETKPRVIESINILMSEIGVVI